MGNLFGFGCCAGGGIGRSEMADPSGGWEGFAAEAGGGGGGGGNAAALAAAASFKGASRRRGSIRPSLDADEFLNLLHGSDPVKIELNRLENEVRGGNVLKSNDPFFFWFPFIL